jgi:hypothetical protein
MVGSQSLWREGFLQDIVKRRKAGMSVLDAHKSWDNYVTGVVYNHNAGVDGGWFRSKAVTQMGFIFQTLNFDEVCISGESSICKRVLRKSAKCPSDARYSRINRVLNAYLWTFTEMNSSLFLNAANLAILEELGVSHVLHMFGGTNKSWIYFFFTIMLMSGYGHFKMAVEGGFAPDRRKPNSVGADTVNNQDMGLGNELCDIVGIPVKDRHIVSFVLTRYTDTVWEQASMATASGNEIVTQPPSVLVDRHIVMTEYRNANMQPILSALPRNEDPGDVAAFNACDKDKRGVYELAVKGKVAQPGLVLLCSNKPDNVQTAEHTKSVMAVGCAMFPGSAFLCNKRSRQDFQDVSRDVNTGRHREFDDKKSVVFFTAYARLVTQLYCGLINRVGAVQTEINKVVEAFIQWGSFFCQQYARGMMNAYVEESFSRMVQGYTSRTVARMAYLKTIDHLSRAKQTTNKELIIKDLLMDLAVDALPVQGVSIQLTTMMSRALDMSSVLLLMVIAEEMEVPVISWEGLNRFFDDDEPPKEAGPFMDEYAEIRGFFSKCIQNRRFCPGLEDGDWDIHHNISCYITGEGRESLTPLYENNGFMRFAYNKEKGGDENVFFSKAGKRFQKMRGDDIFKTCHMGPETSGYTLALQGILKFLPDLRGLASSRMYYSKKHFTKMGFISFLPGLTDYKDLESPPFARLVNFKEGGQVKSEALGVNPWTLLSVVSLAGKILVHPCVNDALAMGLVGQVLAKSPLGCTPNGRAATRFFGTDSKPLHISVNTDDRPSHFLRPEDDTFPSTGVLALARAVGNLLPEDMMHCPMLEAIANTLHCKIYEIPAEAVKVTDFFFYFSL